METVVQEFVHDVTEECKETLEEHGVVESGDPITSVHVVSVLYWYFRKKGTIIAYATIMGIDSCSSSSSSSCSWGLQQQCYATKVALVDQILWLSRQLQRPAGGLWTRALQQVV